MSFGYDRRTAITGLVKGVAFNTEEWQGRKLDVLLMQIEVIDDDEETQEAVGDWHYWMGRRYF
ncbi:MAG: calcium-binding protein [Thiolinea sp.]